MSIKAVITRRRAATGTAPETLEAAAMARASERAAALGHHLVVDRELDHASLVTGDEASLRALEAQGWRVKLHPEAHLIRLGDHVIDTTQPLPRPPKALALDKDEAGHWPHHLVQFVGPIQQSWLAALATQGVDVVEPIGPYGVFVCATPDEMDAVRALDFVAWTGAFQPAWRLHPNLKGAKGRLRYVNVSAYPESQFDAVRAALAQAGAEIVRQSEPGEHNGRYLRMVVEIDAKALPAIARQPGVRWIEYTMPTPGTDGEREAQVLSEGFNAALTATVPGYAAWLTGAGVDGNGVVIAINDTGVDDNADNNTTGHLDLRGRMAAFVDYSGGGSTTDTDGHGTHVAGIACGNAGSNQLEGPAPNNFQRGQGVAPGVNFVAQNGLMGPWPPADFSPFTRDAVLNGAVAQNNSWFSSPPGSGYTAQSRQYDQLARDPNSLAAGLEPLAIVFSAGNAGGMPRTITGPKEAKNPIVVGNALNFLPGAGFPFDGFGINGTSSRGPAMDGRILPHVVAPGTDVIAAQAGSDDQHVRMTGTSMAAPQVTGACGVLVQWWRQRTGGKTPSAALLKAMLVNGAQDLNPLGGQNWFAFGAGGAGLRTLSPVGFVPNAVVDQAGGGVFGVLTPVASAAAVVNPGQWFYNAGTDTLTYRILSPGAFRLYLRDTNAVPPVPNNHQGWGLVSLDNLLFQTPASDRGPRIFVDQRQAFTASGQSYTIRVAPVDPSRPLRVTLVWTDAAGAAGANPALVNDLDLEVVQGATTWRGNQFAGGFSVPGGSFDALNNVECVYIQNPSGTYEVSVIADTLAASARPDIATPWQDFALVIENAEVPPAAPVSVVSVIDRSGSMVFYGYEAATRAASKQFVDLLGVDDHYGIVSFGDTGLVEYPSGPMPSLQAIAGQATRDAGKAEIDGIGFGGCTFMGDGIAKAASLLGGASTAAKAVVLFSDGYDNKGCDAGNPAKPGAAAALAGLPAGCRLHSCAMGHSSDQALLQSLADATGGRYYYMPAIDELFEIYNYIRGQVTGDSIVANESALASRSRVEAFIDAQATEATFTVAWRERLRFAPEAAKKGDEICVRLRDPRGRLLHPHDSSLRRTVGEGHVVFELQEPAAGRWFIEVSTAREAHTRYTAAAFVRSPLRVRLDLRKTLAAVGDKWPVLLRGVLGKEPLIGLRASARWTTPALGLPDLLKKHKAALAAIRPPKLPDGDSIPKPLAQLMALDAQRVKAGKPSLFEQVSQSLRFGAASSPVLGALGLGPTPGALAAHLQALHPGSGNLIVTTVGSVGGSRFVRKDMLSVVAV